MRTIGVVCCFFGTWPEWAHLFIESCRHNPTVDFYLITDCAPPRQIASGNVRLVDLDLAGFNVLASKKLGAEINVKRPYKVADFKPTYGVLFQEYLEGYDFWAFCDLDIVFGNIRGFLTDELLDEYDVIAARPEFITGHFTLFRNVDRITRLYERSRDYLKVFCNEEIFCFDECGPLQFRLLRGEDFADIASDSPIDSIMHVIEGSPDIRTHRMMLCAEYIPCRGFADFEEIRWEKGRVFDIPAQKELMYYHIHFLKADPRFYVPAWEEMPEAFLIKQSGIHWVGEEDLARRLVTAVRRRLHLIKELPSYFARGVRMYLPRLRERLATPQVRKAATRSSEV
jgi:hypothetical protein